MSSKFGKRPASENQRHDEVSADRSPASPAGKGSRAQGLPAHQPGTAAIQRQRDPSAAVQMKWNSMTENWMATAIRPDMNPAPVQRAASGAASATQGLPADGAGKAMPQDVQAKMEGSFGADFSSVRVHEGPRAEALGAQAYTQGADVHFAPGQYQPDSQSGQELLGHELTHVVQQSQGRVDTTTQAKGVAVNDDSGLEAEADVMGARAARGEQARVGGGGGGTMGAGAQAPLQGKFLGGLDNMSVAVIVQKLKEANPDADLPTWKTTQAITKLKSGNQDFSTLKAIADELKLIAPDESGLVQVETVEESPVEDGNKPQETVSEEVSEEVPETMPETVSEEVPEKVSEKEKDSDGAEYKIKRQLGDGSHHTAYELENVDPWILLTSDGDIRNTVKARQKSYSMFDPSITAKMGRIVTAETLEGTTVEGLLLEKMSGDMFHSTNQGWNFGLKKTVMKWKDDMSTYKQKVARTIEGMDTFIGAGKVVDDFQYWVTVDGYFKLSDVKSAQQGDVGVAHAELVNCRNQLQKIHDDL